MPFKINTELVTWKVPPKFLVTAEHGWRLSRITKCFRLAAKLVHTSKVIGGHKVLGKVLNISCMPGDCAMPTELSRHRSSLFVSSLGSGEVVNGIISNA